MVDAEAHAEGREGGTGEEFVEVEGITGMGPVVDLAGMAKG
jgi:hypothetical protein